MNMVRTMSQTVEKHIPSPTRLSHHRSPECGSFRPAEGPRGRSPAKDFRRSLTVRFPVGQFCVTPTA